MILQVLLLSLDTSQATVIIFGALVTGVVTLAAWKVKQWADRQEKNAIRRERKLDVSLLKIDAVVHVLETAPGPISGPDFAREFAKKFRDLKQEYELQFT